MNPCASRRVFAALSAALACCFSFAASLQAAPLLPTLPAPPPAAPSTHLSVLSFGAKGDGSTKDTTAFQKALDAAAGTSGGAVVDVPGGHTYLIGSVALQSNVWLNVESGATIRGSESTSDYPVVTERWEGQDDPCYRGLISAIGTPTSPLTNIAIIGAGTIIGPSGGINLSRPKSPVGPKNIEPRYCKGVYIQGITSQTTKIWNIHPTYCQDVTVSGVTTKGSQANSDGCDPDSCTRVLIENCHFGSGDDDIAIKSGRGIAGAQVNIPTTDVTIENCTFTSCGGASGGVAMGSEISGGLERIFIHNCSFTFTGSNQKAIYIKYAHGRGGFVNDLTVDTITTACQAFKLESNYSNQNYGPYGNGPISGLPGISLVNNVLMTNVTEHGGTALNLLGDPAKLVNNITISNLSAGSIGSVSNVTNFSYSGSPQPSKSNVIAGITTSADSATVSPGGVATFTVTVPSGLSAPVSLKIVGDGIGDQLPAGTTASFSPSTLSGGSGSSTLTFTTSSSTPAGSYSENIEALNSGGSVAWTAAVTLVVSGSGPSSVAAPVFSPSPGAYGTAQSVTIITPTPGATIRYTIDGTTPTETHGTIYSGPVSISDTTTIKAIAYESGFTDSAVISGTYTIGTPPQTFNFEAESLAHTASGATSTLQTDANTSGGHWQSLDGNSVGDFIDFTVPSVPAGTYAVAMSYKTNDNRGILSLNVDGTQVGATLDQYHATPSTYPTNTFGTVTFASAGTHTIRLTVTGKNSASSSYVLSADKFTLVGQ